MAAVQHEANIAVGVRSYDQPMLQMIVEGVWVGSREVQVHQPVGQERHLAVSGPASGKERGYNEE